MKRWRDDPVHFIETVLYDPSTNEPFVLLPAERAFLEYAFKVGPNGKLLYREWLYSCPKKSGKTTFEAIIELTMVLLFGGAFPEAYILANSLEQGRGRCFELCTRIVNASPLLKTRPVSLPTRSPSQPFAQSFRPSLLTPAVPLVPTRSAPGSTNCGLTPAKRRAAFGMK
jgi:hypothetical protein